MSVFRFFKRHYSMLLFVINDNKLNIIRFEVEFVNFDFG